MFFGLFGKNKIEEPIEEAKSVSVSIDKSSKATPDYVADYESAGGKPSTDAYVSAYSSSDLVNSCVSYISEAGGMSKLKIGQKDKSGKMIPLKNKKVRAMFDGAPNQFITWQELIEQSVQSYLLTGNTYLSFEAIAEYELWQLEAGKMQVVPDETTYVAGYIYNDTINFDTTEMIHVRRASADNMYYGTSAVMECLKDSLLLEGYATTDMKEFFENSSVGSGVLSSEFPLSKEQIESVRAQFAANYAQGGKRHSTVILPNKMEYTNIKMSPKESMLLDSLTISSDRVLRTFRMHKVILGGEVDSYSNKMDEIAKLVFNAGIKPIVEKIAAQLQLFFRRLLKTDNLYIWCDYDRVPYLQDGLETKSDAIAKLTASGIMSFNEARDAVGLPQIGNENYDKRFLPAYLYSSTPVAIEDFVAGMDLGTGTAAPTTVSPQGGDNTTATAV